MGFADLSISDLAADYGISVAQALQLCDRLGIAYKNSQTRLALEDAKAIIGEILAGEHRSDIDLENDLLPKSDRHSTGTGNLNPTDLSEPERPGEPRS